MSFTSVTNFVASFGEEFNREEKALKKAKQKIKEAGLKQNPELIEEHKIVILEEWDRKRELGKKIHLDLQTKELRKPNAIFEGRQEITEGEIPQEASSLKNNTIYLEKKCIDFNNKLIGFSDKVEIINNYIHLTEYKTWDNLYTTSGYIAENGFKVPTKYMLHPLEGTEDCNFNHVELQASLYMYMLWNANKKLKFGSLKLEHIKLHENGKIIATIPYNLRYRRDDVRAMLKFKKLNES